MLENEYSVRGECPPDPAGGLAAIPSVRGRAGQEDPWRRPIVYRAVSDRAHELRSLGHDGADGTDDDIQVLIELEPTCWATPPPPGDGSGAPGPAAPPTASTR